MIKALLKKSNDVNRYKFSQANYYSVDSITDINILKQIYNMLV